MFLDFQTFICIIRARGSDCYNIRNYDIHSSFSDRIDSCGEKANIICAGYRTRFRARVGSWVTLTEFDQNTHKMKGIVRKYVDGIEIKGDTWYMAQDGGFVETDKDDYKHV